MVFLNFNCIILLYIIIKEYKLLKNEEGKNYIAINVINKEINGVKSNVRLLTYKTGDFNNVTKKILPEIDATYFIKDKKLLTKKNNALLSKAISYKLPKAGNLMIAKLNNELLNKAIDNEKIINKFQANRKYKSIILAWNSIKNKFVLFKRVEI